MALTIATDPSRLPIVGGVSVLLTCLVCLGCGGQDGLPRYGVSGTVTYQGQPVALGKIQVMPDRQKGNRGPQGFATIRDGKYEIGADKGAITGPVVVLISGGDGQDREIDEGRPYGNWLFQKHRLEFEFDAGNQELDIDVP